MAFLVCGGVASKRKMKPRGGDKGVALGYVYTIVHARVLLSINITTLPPPPPPFQSKTSVEKNKNQLIQERENLTVELRDTLSSFQDSEKRRKNAESALSEAQSRVSDDTSRIQELTSNNDKMKVSLCVWFVVNRNSVS